MPIYEYHCDKCGLDFERLAFGAKPNVACDKCGSMETHKLMSRFGMGRASSSGESSDAAGGSGCGGCSSSSCAGCK